MLFIPAWGLRCALSHRHHRRWFAYLLAQADPGLSAPDLDVRGLVHDCVCRFLRHRSSLRIYPAWKAASSTPLLICPTNSSSVRLAFSQSVSIGETPFSWFSPKENRGGDLFIISGWSGHGGRRSAATVGLSNTGSLCDLDVPFPLQQRFDQREKRLRGGDQLKVGSGVDGPEFSASNPFLALDSGWASSLFAADP